MIQKIREYLKSIMQRTAEAFTVDEIAPTIMAIGTAVIVGGITLLVLAQTQVSAGVQTNTCSAGNSIVQSTGLCNAGSTTLSASWNGLGNAISGIGNIFVQFPLLGTVIGLVLILGVVLFFFYGGKSTNAL